MNGHWDATDGFGGYPGALKGVMLEPTSFFEGIRDTDSIGRALVFALISLVIAGVAQTVWSLAFNALGMGAEMMAAEGSDQQAALLKGLLSSGMNVASGVMMPVFGLIGCFFGAGLTHVCLLLLGGGSNSYMTTAKVYLYAAGPNVLAIIPCVGGFAAGIWSMILVIVGLVVMQKVETMKAAMAVLIPPFLCCCCIAAIGAIVAATAGAGIAAALQNLPH